MRARHRPAVPAGHGFVRDHLDLIDVVAMQPKERRNAFRHQVSFVHVQTPVSMWGER